MPPSAFAIFAFASWGLVPIFWKQLQSFSSFELVCYRIICSSFFLVLALKLRQKELRTSFQKVTRERRELALLLCSGFLIGFNWFLYVWAVNSDHVLEASLGYFINPIFNISLGTIFLRERMRGPQIIACLMACLGVIMMIIAKGAIPWISILLGGSFSLYGLVRKHTRTPTVLGTTGETLLLFPIALVLLLFIAQDKGLYLTHSTQHDWYYVAAIGPVTTLPLLAFAEAARYLPLSALGFFQFISPSLQFLQGLFLFHEPFGPMQFSAFFCIWLGLAIFLFDLRFSRSKK